MLPIKPAHDASVMHCGALVAATPEESVTERKHDASARARGQVGFRGVAACSHG
jgi:hypothetical protein